MSNHTKPIIFLSYSWANEMVADDIDNYFKSIDIVFKRDKRDAPYRSSIKKFMQEVGTTDFVLMIISDEYLRSENCMFEVTELLNTHQFEQRILPVILDNARAIFNSEGRSTYYKFWSEKLKKAKQLKKNYPNSDYFDLEKRYLDIQNNIDVFFKEITALNIFTYDQLKKEGFKSLIGIIGLGEDKILEQVLVIGNLENTEKKGASVDAFVDLYPGNKYVLFQKASMEVENHRYDSAKRYYQKLLIEHPEYAEAHNSFGELLKIVSDFEGAKTHFEQALKMNPQLSSAHFNLADLFENNLRNYFMALQHYQEGLEINPENKIAHNNLARLLSKHFSDRLAARRHLEQALLIDPKFAAAHYNLADLFENQFSYYIGAKEHYEAAIRLEPKFAAVYNDLAYLLSKHFSDHLEARKHYDECLRLNPKFAIGHFNIGCLLMEYFSGEILEAKKHFEECLNLDPRFAKAHFNLGYLLTEYFSDHINAKKHFEECLRLDPKDISAHFYLAKLIKTHFSKHDIGKEVIHVYETKLVVLGNGRVGKTSLINRLLEEKFDFLEPSTHAIRLRRLQLEKLALDNGFAEIQLNIWDFDGKETFTYRPFMKTDALFLLVWDAETEAIISQEEVLPNGKIISFVNHPIRYWLKYIKSFGNDSPVIIIQTKIDVTRKKSTGLSKNELNEYNVKACISVESSMNIANGYAELKSTIDNIILQRITTVNTELPIQWYQVKQAIYGLQAEGFKSLTIDEFKTFCNIQHLNENATQKLLVFLHNIGVLFYNEALLDNRLIIDQKWVINAVYALFDRSGSFVKLHSNGLFSGEDLKEVWQNLYSEEEQHLFLEFMLRSEICFEINYNYIKNFDERQFTAVELLPENRPATTISSAFYESSSIYTRYRYGFLQDSVIQRFIARTGYIANSKEMWQNGILLRPADGLALIEANPETYEITIRVTNGSTQLTYKILNELKELTKEENVIEISYSFDGEYFQSIEKLITNTTEAAYNLNENDKIVLDGNFIDADANVYFEKPKSSISWSSKKSKVFFSYAWYETSEIIVTHLYKSLKSDGYDVVMDKNDLGYKGLISEFMQTIGRGDVVVVAISDKYLRSDYCMYELYELFRNSKLEKKELLKKIYPVRIESIKLNEPSVLRDYLSYWKKREEEYRALVNEFGFDQQQHRKIEAINDSIRDLLPFLNDINASTKEILSADNFAVIKKAIADRIMNND